ncbi:FitA-like ribbon-helix-helix domain-containing protein [Azospirillum rugosum]|uniref:Plasmid stability protein n=1 Tax=Azospirillum rugosum TaxID=416170 RepID=A0ABS4SRV5_9PROT|nr:plasmid stabilization protein [Azospirillum rugosum]MBP2295296.1 plasmid stability protein [Azospirillum rugosum]MDQ0528671.1 plasmid stability protein [Azospirillum rugosum]
MGHLILNDLDDDLLNRLKTRAATHGRSLEEEHLAILREALSSSTDQPVAEDEPSDFWERAARRRERMRERLGGQPFPDTTRMIREMRDQRAGLIPDDEE